MREAQNGNVGGEVEMEEGGEVWWEVVAPEEVGGTRVEGLLSVHAYGPDAVIVACGMGASPVAKFADMGREGDGMRVQAAVDLVEVVAG